MAPIGVDTLTSKPPVSGQAKVRMTMVLMFVVSELYQFYQALLASSLASVQSVGYLP